MREQKSNDLFHGKHYLEPSPTARRVGKIKIYLKMETRKIIEVLPSNHDTLTYVNSDLNIRPGRTNGAEKLSLHQSKLTAETPFKVWHMALLKRSEAHLHFKEEGKKPYPLTDITVVDSNLHLSSDVDIDIEEMNTYKSLDIRVSGDSKVYLDLRNFNLDKIYLDLSNLSEDSFTHILLKDGVKLWVNTKGRVGASQLRIEGLPKMEVTSM